MGVSILALTSIPAEEGVAYSGILFAELFMILTFTLSISYLKKLIKYFYDTKLVIIADSPSDQW